jgi:hypothetical protein
MSVKLDLTLREEHILTVFENRVQISIFEPKREEVAGGWTTLHSAELRSLHISSSIIRMKSKMT